MQIEYTSIDIVEGGAKKVIAFISWVINAQKKQYYTYFWEMKNVFQFYLIIS